MLQEMLDELMIMHEAGREVLIQEPIGGNAEIVGQWTISLLPEAQCLLQILGASFPATMILKMRPKSLRR